MTYNIWDTCILFPGFSRSECASWVQAWGSIAAILVAVWVSRDQANRANKLAASSARKRAQILFNTLYSYVVAMRLSDLDAFVGLRTIRVGLAEVALDSRSIAMDSFDVNWISASQALRLASVQILEVVQFFEAEVGTIKSQMELHQSQKRFQEAMEHFNTELEAIKSVFFKNGEMPP